MGFVGRKPTNAPLTSDDIPNGIIGAEDLAAGLSKITFDTTPKTTGFTAVANTGYFCNTTSAAFTVTLPATPSAGDEIVIVDYAGTFATNNLIITSTPKINGSDNDVKLTTNREATRLVYIDSTQGWLAYSGVNEGTAPSLTDNPPPYSVDFLVIAGGGGGGRGNTANTLGGAGGGAGGYRNSFSTETSGGNSSSETSLTFAPGIVYTVTVGAGGAAAPSPNTAGTVGVDSSISGTGITTITSAGGGGGAGSFLAPPANNGGAGGSGGGSGDSNVSPYPSGSAGLGTANQGFDGGLSIGGADSGGGGGGGASAVGGNASSQTGGNGGAGLASSITGSSVDRAGGGAGAGGSTGGTGGTGGGGNGGASSVSGTAGGANTGGGGGGSANDSSLAGAGGKGVVILRMPDASYSGTTTGSPTVNTNVGGSGETVIIFNDSGSITG